MKKPKTEQLGIFQGKKANYNKLILQSLAFGSKTTKQIALYIVQKSPKSKHWKNVSSVISRRSTGGLPKLYKNEYIKHENSFWSLTFKGTAVASVLLNNVDLIIDYVKKDMESLKFEEFLQKLTLSPFFPSFLRPNVFSTWLKQWLLSKEFYLYIKKATEELIKEGVPLDSMTSNTFRNVILANSFQDVAEKKFLATFTDMLDEQLKTE